MSSKEHTIENALSKERRNTGIERKFIKTHGNSLYVSMAQL